MKISVTKDDLTSGLQAVQNVVGARSTLPILSNVLLVADAKRLELRATDLEVSVHASVTANVESEGATSMPAKRLFGLVREIEASEIDIEVSDKEVATVQAGASKYKLNGIGAEEYPQQAKFKESGKIKVKQVKSSIGYNRRQRATLTGLGLRRINHVVEIEDTPSVRGMINKVNHLVVVVED